MKLQPGLVMPGGIVPFGSEGGIAAPGQQVFLSSGGNQTFIVPSGITTISAVAIAPGIIGFTNGVSYTQGGYGGGLSYHPGIAVTPGETLDITTGGGEIRLRRGGISGTILVGVAGQSPDVTSGTTRYAGGNGFYTLTAGPFQGDGGWAGQYNAIGSDGSGNNGLNGVGISLLGSSPGGGTLYGAGGADGGTAGSGAIRIIWGPGRSYPSTGVANQ